jgi:Secretion system C-terminal sorting domain
MKHIANGSLFTSRVKRTAISFAACALFLIASNHQAFGQWTQSAGYNSDPMRGFFGYPPYLLVDVASSGTPVTTIDSLYASTDNGQSWIPFAPNGGVPLAAVAVSGIPNLIGTASYPSGGGSLTGILSYSNDYTNKFKTWLPDTVGYPNINANYAAFSLATIGTTIFAADGAFGVYQQTTPETTYTAKWTPDTVGMTVGGTPLFVNSLIVFANNIFANASAGIFVSANQGASWTPANNGITISQTGFTPSVVSFAAAGSSLFAMVALYNNSTFADSLYYFYRTTDNGQNWTQMNSTPLISNNGVTQFAASSQTLFVAGDSGINFSNDNGATWQQGNQGLPNLGPTSSSITSMQVSGTNLVIGILGINQIWYSPLSYFASSSVAPSAAPSTSLNLTISGNPASGSSVTISYTLPASGVAQITLMDELGRDVRVLQNGRASAGQNVVTIDPLSIEQGTYFVRVEAGGMSAMQKLVISR